MNSVLLGLFFVFSSTLKVENHQYQVTYHVTESKLNTEITKNLKINLDDDAEYLSGGCNFFAT